MKACNVTRGHGFLEGFLAEKRSGMANSLIPDKSRSGRILDIGCGQIPFFLINTEFEEKHGIDSCIDESRKFQGIHVKKTEARGKGSLEFSDGYFDVVTILAVIEHIEPDNLTKFLEEIKRILKPGGRLILTTPCPWSDKILRALSFLGFVSKEEIDDHKSALSHRNLRKHLSDTGFSEERMRFGYFEIFLNIWATVVK